jgi:hypothetical protein
MRLWYLNVRRERLVARHVAFGKTPDAAANWVADVDEVNAVAIERLRGRANRIVTQTDQGWVVSHARG